MSKLTHTTNHTGQYDLDTTCERSISLANTVISKSTKLQTYSTYKFQLNSFSERDGAYVSTWIPCAHKTTLSHTSIYVFPAAAKCCGRTTIDLDSKALTQQHWRKLDSKTKNLMSKVAAPLITDSLQCVRDTLLTVLNCQSTSRDSWAWHRHSLTPFETKGCCFYTFTD